MTITPSKHESPADFARVPIALVGNAMMIATPTINDRAFGMMRLHQEKPVDPVSIRAKAASWNGAAINKNARIAEAMKAPRLTTGDPNGGEVFERVAMRQKSVREQTVPKSRAMLWGHPLTAGSAE